MLKPRFLYIHSRADFFRVLDETILETSQKIAANPGWTTLESIMQQLLFIRATTAHGRKPPFEERKRISLGAILIREFESPPDLEWDDYKSKVSELALYYKLWQTDAGLQNIEKNGYEGSVNWDDLSDEPDTP